MMNLENISNYLSLNYWILASNKKTHYPQVNIQNILIKSKIPNNQAIKVSVFSSHHKKPKQTLIIASGLSPLGPDDIRLIKLASVFAQSGFVVYVPYIFDYMNLQITPNTESVFKVCFDHVYEKSKQRPNILSISFGSLLALKLATCQKRREKIKRLVLFGGYCDWLSTVDSIINGDKSPSNLFNYDTRSLPIIFNHLLESICKDVKNVNINLIRYAIREYVKKTTTLNETSITTANLLPIAKESAINLNPLEKDFFLLGCGFSENYKKTFMDHLKKNDFHFLNPFTEKNNVCSPVYLFHSRQDNVISVKQYDLLKKNLPQDFIKKSFLISLYNHSDKVDHSFISLLKNNFVDLHNMSKLLWEFSRI